MIFQRTLVACFITMMAIRSADAQKLPAFSMDMQLDGAELKKLTANDGSEPTPFEGEAATSLLVDVLNRPSREEFSKTRSAKDIQIYKSLAPSVVLVVTKDGLGSGSLISPNGDVLTNYHVVKGFSTVAVIFKPASEGAAPDRNDVKVATVVKFDQVSDLALLKIVDVPPGRSPIRLGSTDEISVGADVHAIGHPQGEVWTYTVGVISQYRMGYKWKSGGDEVQHIADVVQTQTPINFGNSGGPLISDGSTLIGVNSFKAKDGDGLNYAVSVDDVKRFLLRTSPASSAEKAKRNTDCKPKALSKYRSADNASSITSFDMFCDGRASGEYVVPDKVDAAIFLRVDRNADGKADVIFFDLKRTGKWDISWWDDRYSGQWSLVGYHDDGTLKPSRFESYSDYQKRVLANRQSN